MHSKSFIILGILAILFLAPSLSHAVSTPTGVIAYSQTNVTNSQTVGAGNSTTGFQQMMNISLTNYRGYTNDTGKYSFQNVEFFNSTSGAVLNSWLESYSFTNNWALYWIKLPDGIGTSQTLSNIYVGFGLNTTSFWSNSSVGESPLLSPNYGGRDDGKSVFQYYTNFNGTSLPTGWTNSGITYTVNNGISATATTASGYISYGTSVTAPIILEGYGNLYQSSSNWTGLGIMTVPVVNQAGYQGMAISTGLGSGFEAAGTYQGTQTESGTTTYVGGNTATNGNQIWRVDYISTSSSAYWTNYAQIGTTITSPTVSTPLYPAIFEAGAAAKAYNFTDTASLKWFRTRVYPPNGDMPTISQGSLQLENFLNLILNNIADSNITNAYGITSNFTCLSNNGNYCRIYVNGTAVNSYVKSQNIYLKSYYSSGLYKVTAQTNASGVSNVTYYETISKATPTLTATVNSHSFNGTYTIRDANLSLSGTVTSGLTADFYNNGKLLGTSTQTITYNYSTLGTHTIIFNTSGNQNYTSKVLEATVNLTTNQWTLQDVAQNSTHLSTFNLTVKNGTSSATKTFNNLAYGSVILYKNLPLGSDTFNFSHTSYNWTTNSTTNSIYTATNQTLTGVQWEWIYFNAKVSQTGLALSDFGFNLSDTNSFKYIDNNIASQAQLSLQKLYSGTATVTVNKTGYNTTVVKYAFTSLSPSTNTYTLTVGEAAITINVYDTNTKVVLPNATITIANATTNKIFTNITTPLFEIFSNIPLGNDTITVTRYWPKKADWTTSYYYVTLTSHSALNLSTYIFNTSFAVLLTFQVQAPYGALQPNAVMYLEDSQSPFNILQECKTLGNGQCQMDGATYTSYQYYAALPYSDQVSALSPLYSASSGSGGICPSGVWCSYLSVTLSPLSTVPNMNLTYSPEESFLSPATNTTYSVGFSTTKNDVNELLDNYTVLINGTVTYSHVYIFDSNPTAGTLTFTQPTPAAYTSKIIENVTISQSTGDTTVQYIYYVQGSPGGAVNNSAITNELRGIGTGLGPAGFMIFFFIVLVGVTILVWVLSQGNVLATMLIMDAVTGLFAYLGVFNLAIGGYGSYLGWGMFAVFTFWTIAFPLSKIGGMT